MTSLVETSSSTETTLQSDDNDCLITLLGKGPAERLQRRIAHLGYGERGTLTSCELLCGNCAVGAMIRIDDSYSIEARLIEPEFCGQGNGPGLDESWYYVDKF